MKYYYYFDSGYWFPALVSTAAASGGEGIYLDTWALLDRVEREDPGLLDRLFAASRKHSVRDHAIFRVAFCKALRASEVGILQLSDYDSRANTLHVTRLKGSNSGTLPLFTAELAAVRAWLKHVAAQPRHIPITRG